MPSTAPDILHGADVSYFSGKVRPAFPQKNLWVREVMPDILEIKRRTGLHFFPVVETPGGELWQDTSDILDRLEVAHPDPPLFPVTPVQRIVAYLIELYGDEMGILPAMHYRWSFEESVAKVGYDAEGKHQSERKPRRNAGSRTKIHPTGPGVVRHSARLIGT